MLAFADKYEVPAIFPQEFGFKWWWFVLEQDSLVSSIVTSFIVAIIVTAVSLIICIPTAYALASIFTFLGSLEEAQGTLLVGFPLKYHP